MSRQSLSNTVCEERHRSGVTQEEFAAKVGVTRQTVSALEKGNYVPSVLLALKVARYFKKPVEKIFILR